MFYKFNSFIGRLVSSSQFKYLPQGMTAKGPKNETQLKFDNPKEKSVPIDPYYVEPEVTEGHKIVLEGEGIVKGLPNLRHLKEYERVTVGPIGTYPDTAGYRKWVLEPQLKVSGDPCYMEKPTYLKHGGTDYLIYHFTIFVLLLSGYLTAKEWWDYGHPPVAETDEPEEN